MDEIRDYWDLKVWEKSMRLALETYRVTHTFPDIEKYGLISQMRRAAVSVPSNIAEGHGRFGGNELRKLLSIASGSLAELATQIYLSYELDYLPSETKDCLLAAVEEITKMLHGFRKSLSK